MVANVDIFVVAASSFFKPTHTRDYPSNDVISEYAVATLQVASTMYGHVLHGSKLLQAKRVLFVAPATYHSSIVFLREKKYARIDSYEN